MMKLFTLYYKLIVLMLTVSSVYECLGEDDKDKPFVSMIGVPRNCLQHRFGICRDVWQSDEKLNPEAAKPSEQEEITSSRCPPNYKKDPIGICRKIWNRKPNQKETKLSQQEVRSSSRLPKVVTTTEITSPGCPQNHQRDIFGICRDVWFDEQDQNEIELPEQEERSRSTLPEVVTTTEITSPGCPQNHQRDISGICREVW